MFKWASVAEEVADEMEKIQAEAVYTEESASEQKRLKALAYLNEAAESFDFSGHKTEAEALTHLIEKIAQDNFEEEAPEVSEQQDEQPGLEEPKQLDTRLDALDALNYYSNLVSQGNPVAMKEYIPGVMYLRTVMLGNPKEEIFAKFEQEGVPGWVAQIAQFNPGILKQILSSHLESIGSSLGRIDSDLATFFAAAPRPDTRRTGDDLSLPEIVPMDAAELAVWRRHQSGEELTPAEEQILERKRREAEKQQQRDAEKTIQKEKSREVFQEKQREERQQQREEKLQEQAPSAVRRIDPLTGRVKEEIPVELGKGRGGAPKWKRMTQKEKERQSRKPQEKREAPERFMRAQVYPEGRFWMVELPGETRPKRFQTQEQAINFTQGKVGNEFKVLNRAPIRASRLDIIEKLAGQYENLAKKKEDANKAVDKQVPIEETAPAEEYWEDE